MMRDTIKQDASSILNMLLAGLYGLAIAALTVFFVFGLQSDDIVRLFGGNSKAGETSQKPGALKPGMPKTGIPKSGGSLPKTKSSLGGRPKVKFRSLREIRQYSEFISVKHAQLPITITTGIRYDDSTNQNIVSQWCYAHKSKTQKDGFSVHLSIKKTEKGKSQSFAPYSVQTLREFGLTQVLAKDLPSYCRFK